MTTAPDQDSRLEGGVQWIGVAVLAVLTWRVSGLPIDGSGEPGFLHLPDLVFHEAGGLSRILEQAVDEARRDLLKGTKYEP